MTIAASETSSFVEFPDRQGILEVLRSIEVYETGMEPMFHLVAERLASQAYDRSAFVFILLELIYEFEEDTITFSDLLGRMVFALAGDLDLVGEALEAFEEICVTLAPGPGAAEAEDGEEESVADLWSGDADHEHLMLELQQTQKRVLDFGLATRVSIEMALTRPSKANVKQTLRDMTELRQNLLRFEELLRESEQRLLEAIGVLD